MHCQQENITCIDKIPRVWMCSSMNPNTVLALSAKLGIYSSIVGEGLQRYDSEKGLDPMAEAGVSHLAVRARFHISSPHRFCPRHGLP